MLVSGFMHSRDRGYSGSAPETGPHRCGTAPDSHRTSPTRRLSTFAVGRVYVEEQVRERQDLLGGGHPFFGRGRLLVQDNDCLRLPAHSRMLTLV